MKKIFYHPLFLVGLILRISLILLFSPKASLDWYAPFLDLSTSPLSLDPWNSYLSQGGTAIAFPYGYAMYLALLPLTLVCKLIGLPIIFGYGFSLLAADFALLVVLRKILPSSERLLLTAYWFSPIVLLATYGLGLNDLIPSLFLVIALYFTRKLNLFWAGVFCAVALSAKLSMIIAIPFFLIYLMRNRALRQLLPAYAKGFAIGFLALFFPFVFSSAGMQMLFNNPEMGKVYQFTLQVGANNVIFVLPLAYLVMLYSAWRVRRLNFELFHALLGIGFLLVVLLTPASPGWFVWIVPLLIFYQAMGDKGAMALAAAFSALFALNNLLAPPLANYIFPSLVIDSQRMSLLHTMMTAVGIVLTMRIWRQTVSSNDYFRFSRKPFVIGIAGDSGSGKDTLAESIQVLFGKHSVAHLAGDDYHLWDRQKPMWQVMTHLNPMANDLESYANDLVKLTDGKNILSRYYDHKTGKMGRPSRVKSNDFILASGLHALYLPVLRECYDLAIYLDIDEGLRRHYKLQRDVIERGHSPERTISSLEKREPDSVRFIRPQAAHAGLVMSLQPINPRIKNDSVSVEQPRLKLLVRSKNGLNGLSLVRVLVGTCGLHVDMDNSTDEVILTIEGESSAQDVAMAAKILFPRIIEFLDINPEWKDGTLGLMQLIVMAHINQALTKRLI